MLTGCSTIKVNEDKPVVADIYIVHSKLKSYETFPDSRRRIWNEGATIDDVIESFPEGSNPTIIHKTTATTQWDKLVEIKETNFLNADSWDIKNKEWLNKVTDANPVITSLFKFKMTPKHLEDGRNVALMTYTLEFLREVAKAENKELYYTNTDLFKDAKEVQFLTDRYYVFGALSLKNKESLILIYKLTND